MQLNIKHNINYFFKGIIKTGFQKVLLKPKQTPFQKITKWDINIIGGIKEISSLDQFDNNVDIFRLQNNKWEIIKYVKLEDNFLVTDAEILPMGLLLILERKFSWTQGFKTRFRLISLDKFDNRETITIFTSTANQFDNLEGLALWKDKKGEMRILTVSDDNFHPLQQSEIREFFLKYE